MQNHAQEITVMDTCFQALPSNSVYTVLDSPRNTLSGWSHIDTAAAEYKELRLSNKDYQISSVAYVSDKTCETRKIQNAVLVVKLSDWTRQHSNGFEALLDKDNVYYGNVTHVLLDLKINAQRTQVPSQDELNSRYSSLLEANQLAELDQSKVNLGITLFAKGARDQSTRSFNIEHIFAIDQTRLADQWLRIVLPLDQFSAFTQQNYSNISANLKDYTQEAIFGIRINPETHNGKQLRNLIGDRWHDDIQESFKEIDISLSRIELLNLFENAEQ